MSGKTTTIFSTIAFFILVGLLSVSSCRKSNSARANARPMNFVIPEGFPAPVYNFSENPLTEEGFALGRKLFHDNRLSKNADVTCSSCHQQHAAYTTFDHDLGHGTNHQHTTRNVPVIFNMAWYNTFEWDGRVTDLNDQPLACMTAPEKMGEDVDAVVAKLHEDEEYRTMFGEAFGGQGINGTTISKALTQFVLMLVSSNSKYDKVKKGEEAFNESEQNGYNLFKAKCATCHEEPLFTDLTFRNNGLPKNQFHFDNGRMEVTGSPADSLKFKVPTLRNIALTGYYVHDGRYISIGQMLDHYSTGIQQSSTLDPSLTNGIPLTDLEKFYLEEFLFTLTDSTLVSDPRFE
jgi:cytochrome c peroxidase